MKKPRGFINKPFNHFSRARIVNTEQTSLVFMLEDDHDRISRFAAVLSSHRSGLRFVHWRTSQAFIKSFASLPDPPKLIALDHDLFVDDPSDPDPGDGRDVAAYLAKQKPIAPILIHSSNSIAADSMLFTLRDSGWNVDRIAPIGEDWIEAYWFPIALEMMQKEWAAKSIG